MAVQCTLDFFNEDGEHLIRLQTFGDSRKEAEEAMIAACEDLPGLDADTDDLDESNFENVDDSEVPCECGEDDEESEEDDEDEEE